MTTRTSVKAGGRQLNHNETLSGFKTRTATKAGRTDKLAVNHNESLRGVPTKTSIKAGQKVR